MKGHLVEVESCMPFTPNKRVVIDQSTLRQMYHSELKSIRTIASELGSDYGTVRYYLKKFNIRTRSYPEAEVVFRETRRELYENRLRRVKEARQLRFGTQFHGKQEIFRVLRQAIRPFITLYREEHPICEKCSKRDAVEVHHLIALNDLVCELVENGMTINKVACEVTKRHYTGEVKVCSLCSECHKKFHRW